MRAAEVELLGLYYGESFNRPGPTEGAVDLRTPDFIGIV